MSRIAYKTMRAEFERILEKLGFSTDRAARLAGTFTGNSLDGVYSHGLNRFPSFVLQVKSGVVKTDTEAEKKEAKGALEIWDGNLAPGIINAAGSMQRAMQLADEYGIGCVGIRNTNHWLRGGTYGWQAADAGYAAVCFTNASAGMPPWGGTEPRLGNNPLVIAVPRKEGHVVLDTALSQYSYGKLQQYEFKGEELPFDGGYDRSGTLTRKPAEIIATKKALPIGYWKGSGLALLLDVLLVALTGGRSVGEITASGHESGVCQCFIALKNNNWHDKLVNAVIAYTKSGGYENSRISFPGENTLRTRKENTELGIPVEEKVWQQVLKM